jgi:PAS domain S-box-containing protein
MLAPNLSASRFPCINVRRYHLPAVPLSDDPSSRIAGLEGELEAARAELARVASSEWRLRRMLEVTQETLAVFDKGIIIELNPQFEEMFRCSRAEAIGRSALDFTAPASRDDLIQKMRSGHAEPYEATLMRNDGTTFVARIRGRTAEHEGRVLRFTAFLDLTQQKLAEKALLQAELHEEMIRVQASLIAELSTPLLPIARGAVVLPLVGRINGARAGQILDTLTQGVVAHAAQFAILDVTGAALIDAEVADMLLAAARAVELLGARVLLTGVRAEMARALIALDRDLGRLLTFATLAQGVAHALGARRGS